MATTTPTTLSRLLSSLPLPNAPFDQIAKDDPEVAQYLRRLHRYLADLVSRFGIAEQAGLTLPPIPDPSVDWYLEYIAGDKRVEWYQKPDAWFIIPPVSDVHEAEPDKSLGNVEWFNNGATMEAGQYIVGYYSGALDYGGDTSDSGSSPSPTGTFHLQHSDLHAYFIVYQNASLYGLLDSGKTYGDRLCRDYDHAGSAIVNQIAQYYGPGYGRVNWNVADDHFGFDNTYGEQWGVEAAFAGQFVVINHDGSGPIGMRLYDYPRHDNVAMDGGSLPKFYLAKAILKPYYRNVL